jgi:hypothetical protein
MGHGNRHHSVTIRGLVTPSAWDENDQVCGVSILTFDDDEFEVEPVDAGEYLISYIRQEVMARGHLVPAYRKRKVIRIKSFTVFGEDAPETYQDDSGFPGRQIRLMD